MLSTDLFQRRQVGVRPAWTLSFLPAEPGGPPQGGTPADADAWRLTHEQLFCELRITARADLSGSDVQLTLAQRVPVAGALIVTTPQDIALLDARKAYKMFDKVEIPVLGVVENMSTHICTQCGHEETIFGSGGGEKMSEDYEVPLLGSLPLALKIRQDLDRGVPTVVRSIESITIPGL